MTESTLTEIREIVVRYAAPLTASGRESLDETVEDLAALLAARLAPVEAERARLREELGFMANPGHERLYVRYRQQRDEARAEVAALRRQVADLTARVSWSDSLGRLASERLARAEAAERERDEIAEWRRQVLDTLGYADGPAERDEVLTYLPIWRHEEDGLRDHIAALERTVAVQASCSCGHEPHLHDHEAVPSLCLTCGHDDDCGLTAADAVMWRAKERALREFHREAIAEAAEEVAAQATTIARVQTLADNLHDDNIEHELRAALGSDDVELGKTAADQVAAPCGCARRLTTDDPGGHDFVSHNACALVAGVATVCLRCGVWAGRATEPCLAAPSPAGPTGDTPVAEPIGLAAAQAETIARVQALANEWEQRAGEASEARRVFGPQVVNVTFAVEQIRAALATPDAEPSEEVTTEYVVGFALGDDGRVALIRKNRPEWQAGRLNGIGGHVEPGEAPLDAMKREFREETGVGVTGWEPLVVMDFPGARIHFYRALVGAAVLDLLHTTTDEEVVVQPLMTCVMAPAHLIPNLTWLLPLAAYMADHYAPIHVRAESAEEVAGDAP